MRSVWAGLFGGLAIIAAGSAWGQTPEALKAICLGNRGDPIAACTALISQGQQSDADLAAILLARGQAYAAVGNHRLAIADFDAAIAHDASLIEAYRARTREAAAEQAEKSPDVHGSTASEAPAEAAGYFQRAMSSARSGDLNEALADYSAAIHLNPRYVQALNNRGMIYERKGDYDRALADYDAALKIDPQHSKTWHNRGDVRSLRKEWALAVADYDKAIALDDADGEAFRNRANAHHMLKQDDLALKDYEQALDINPEDVLAYYDRGVVLYAVGRKKEAFQSFKTASSMDARFKNPMLKLPPDQIDDHPAEH